MAKHKWMIVLGFLGGSAGAQETIDTDRPDQTESPFTVPARYFQLEAGFNRENIHGKDYSLIYPTLLLKYGMKKMEFRLETQWHSDYHQLTPEPEWTTGIDPLELGFKLALWEEKGWLPKTSLIGGIGIPGLASKAFHADYIAPAFRFTMQNSIAKHVTLSYNLGAEWDGYSKRPDWIYTVATGFDIGERWYTYLEAFGFLRQDIHPQHNLDAGLAYFISNNVKVDVSGGFGISKDSPKNYMAIGFSFRCDTKRH